jgi:hypothetical protein
MLIRSSPISKKEQNNSHLHLLARISIHNDIASAISFWEFISTLSLDQPRQKSDATHQRELNHRLLRFEASALIKA